MFSIPRLRTPGVFLLIFVAWNHSANAGVEVFTIAGEPVVNVPDSAAVVELDAAARLDARISDGLPADRVQARQMVESRVSGPDFQQTMDAYGQFYQGLARAWMLGIEKVPAVVVDSRYVVYGEPDVGQALLEIEQAQESGL